jgi:thiamine-phosphate pyrophosphorylase
MIGRPDRAPLLYLVTDRRRLAPAARTAAAEVRALEQWLDAALEAGIDVIQLRERDLAARAQWALASRVVERAAGRPTMVLVNDRADVAAAARAQGVHLRADGVAVARLRASFAGWTVGRSAHSSDELAAAAGADYVLFGTVFPSPSKPGAAGAGVDALRRAVAASPAPVIAIGGIDAATARACVEAGAAGVAAIGLFLPPSAIPAAIYLRQLVGELRAEMR